MKHVPILVVVLLAVTVIALLAARQRYPKLKIGEILPAGEMKTKYGLTIDRYKACRLDPANVPDEFRDLVPLAQKWGIGDDIIRNHLQEKASKEERQSLREALDGRTTAIHQWLDTFGEGEMTEEAGAFMYMLLGLDEMDDVEADPDPASP